MSSSSLATLSVLHYHHKLLCKRKKKYCVGTIILQDNGCIDAANAVMVVVYNNDVEEKKENGSRNK